MNDVIFSNLEKIATYNQLLETGVDFSTAVDLIQKEAGIEPSPNIFLEKVADLLSRENKEVSKTFAMQTAAALPAHALGGIIGSKLGDKYLGGLASSTNKGIRSLAARAKAIPRIGTTTSKIVRGLGGISGKSLGIGIGVSAVGGLADLAALKHGLHGKVKKNE